MNFNRGDVPIKSRGSDGADDLMRVQTYHATSVGIQKRTRKDFDYEEGFYLKKLKLAYEDACKVDKEVTCSSPSFSSFLPSQHKSNVALTSRKIVSTALDLITADPFASLSNFTNSNDDLLALLESEEEHQISAQARHSVLEPSIDFFDEAILSLPWQEDVEVVADEKLQASPQKSVVVSKPALSQDIDRVNVLASKRYDQVGKPPFLSSYQGPFPDSPIRLAPRRSHRRRKNTHQKRPFLPHPLSVQAVSAVSAEQSTSNVASGEEQPILLALTSFPYRIISANGAFTSLTGRTDVVGGTFFDLFLRETTRPVSISTYPTLEGVVLNEIVRLKTQRSHNHMLDVVHCHSNGAVHGVPLLAPNKRYHLGDTDVAAAADDDCGSTIDSEEEDDDDSRHVTDASAFVLDGDVFCQMAVEKDPKLHCYKIRVQQLNLGFVPTCGDIVHRLMP